MNKILMTMLATFMLFSGACRGSNSEQNDPYVKMTPITDFGKSVDWSAELGMIASERPGRDGYYDVFLMKPDGSEVVMLTSRAPGFPRKHNGNPCVHPAGKYIVFTGENPALKDDSWMAWRCAVPGSGLGADLYVMDIETGNVRRLTEYPLSGVTRCVIHPQFSNNGKLLAWAERVRRGTSFGGGWVIRIARFNAEGTPRLTNIRTLAPGEHSCFYEVHDFSPDDTKLLFSGNLVSGQAHTGLDIYELNLLTGELKRLTHTPVDWDEHAHYSPDGKLIAWMSSVGYEIDYGPEKGMGVTWAQHLKTELCVMNSDGTDRRVLTGFNMSGYPEYTDGVRCIVSDNSWSPDGSALCAAVASFVDGRFSVELMRVEIVNQ